MTDKKIVIFGGGTTQTIRPHLALSAPAYGHTARKLNNWASDMYKAGSSKLEPVLYLSRMAHENHFGAFDSVDDLDSLVEKTAKDPLTKIVMFTCAVVDFDVTDVSVDTKDMGKILCPPASRMGSGFVHDMHLVPREKLIAQFRKERKDIFVIGFKQTFGLSEQEQYIRGLAMLKMNSINLVFANDDVTGNCMIITPEESAYEVTKDRDCALEKVLQMAMQRSHLSFTQSTVVAGTPIPWADTRIPASLRKVVEYCIERGAYRPFRGVTTGHFAFKIDDQTFVTSIRKTDFNKIYETGMVLVKTDGPDTVLAYGAKPSVGGQSQRIVFNDHPGYDCIVHFHCEKKPGSLVPVRSQREFECGSHECGRNTSQGLGLFETKADGEMIKAVYLDRHGPNIVFKKTANPQTVIDFIEANFDLDTKSGGYQIDGV